MKAKMEHIAIKALNPYREAKWLEKYFGFKYVEGDELKEEGMENTRTTLENEAGDWIEVFSCSKPNCDDNNVLCHFAFAVDDIQAYYDRFKEDDQLNQNCEIINFNTSKLFFVETPEGVSIELIQR